MIGSDMCRLQFVLKSLDYGIAQFLGRCFCPDLCVIILRIVITPFIVVILAVLTSAILLRNMSPDADLF